MTLELMWSRMLLLSAIAALLVSYGCASASIGGAQEFGDFSEPPPAGPLLAAGLEITSVTISQGVSIDLLRDGEEPGSYSAPLLTGRPGIVRVFVEPGEDWSARPIRGEMTLSSALGDLVFEDEEEPDGISQAASFATTFDFEFPAVSVDVHRFPMTSIANIYRSLVMFFLLLLLGKYWLFLLLQLPPQRLGWLWQ